MLGNRFKWYCLNAKTLTTKGPILQFRTVLRGVPLNLLKWICSLKTSFILKTWVWIIILKRKWQKITISNWDMCQIVIEELSEIHQNICELGRRHLVRRHARARHQSRRRKFGAVQWTTRLRESWEKYYVLSHWG